MMPWVDRRVQAGKCGCEWARVNQSKHTQVYESTTLCTPTSAGHACAYVSVHACVHK